MSKKLMCPVSGCKGGPFKGGRGLDLHRIRMHTNKGKAWGSTKGTTMAQKAPKATVTTVTTMAASNSLVQEATSVRKKPGRKPIIDFVQQALASHPEGLNASAILKAIKKLGFRTNAKGDMAGTVIGGAVSRDKSNSVTAENGVYRAAVSTLEPVTVLDSTETTQELSSPIDRGELIAQQLHENAMYKKNNVILSDMLMGAAQIIGQVAQNLRPQD